MRVGINSNIKWCPKPDCGKTVVKPRFCSCSNRTQCECGLEVCFKCGREWHAGQCRDDGNTAFQVYGMLHNVAKCPNCKAPSEKIDGCNKMTCARCNTHFCWLCREKLSQDKPYDHFEDPLSGCFGNGMSCGGCYIGILLAQLIIFVLTPIILYFLLLYTLIKKWKLWKLYGPSIDVMRDSHYSQEVMFVSGLLVGSGTMIFMIPIALIACVPTWALMLYRIVKVFAIRFCCCLC